MNAMDLFYFQVFVIFPYKNVEFLTVMFQPPTVVCSICKRDGHLKDECPEDFKKIELKPLPPMNDRFRDILSGLCKLCYCKTSLLVVFIIEYEFTILYFYY